MIPHEEYTAGVRDAGQRLDVFLAAQSGLTRARIRNLIEKAQVLLDDVPASKAGVVLREGQRVRMHLPEPVPSEARPQDLPLEILYQDASLAVVNKPSGMVVHPAVGNEDGTMVNALLHHLDQLSGIGGVMRPGIVHRLDKDTSGVLLVAKNDQAHVALSGQLAAHKMQKTYAALALGRFREPEGEIDAPIARDPRGRKRMAVLPGGRQALTYYHVVEEFAACSLLRVRIVTGRTHQIRVHLRSVGHAVVGDSIYGPPKAAVTAPRLMLHAARLCFEHPATGEALCFTAPLPEAFEAVLQKQRAPFGSAYMPPNFFS